MRTPPSVTVIVPVKRSQRTIRANVESLFGQDYGGELEIMLVGDVDDPAFDALSAVVGDRYTPGLVLAGGPAEGADGFALLAGRPTVNGRPTAYVCRHYVCEAPQVEPDGLAAQLETAP